MRYNRVLFICVDALSSQYQGAFESCFNVVYQNYRTTQTWTLSSHVAMLAGINLPELFHVFDVKNLQKWKGYVENIPTLATTLRQIGFKTKAITSGGYLSRYFGWGHDWDEWQTPEEGFAEWNGEKLLPEKGELLFLHTYFVHNWFQKSKEFSDLLERNYKLYDRHEKYDVSFIKEAQLIYERRIKLLSQKLRWINATPVDTLVVFTSDHGEIFDPTGISFHHGDLAINNSKVFNVPLMMKTKSKNKVVYDEFCYDLSLTYLIEKEIGYDRFEHKPLIHSLKTLFKR